MPLRGWKTRNSCALTPTHLQLFTFGLNTSTRPSDGNTASQSCLASLLLLFHIPLFTCASDPVQNKCLGACPGHLPSPQPLPALPFRVPAVTGSASFLAGCRSSSQRRHTGTETGKGIWRAGAAPRERGIASEESSSKRNIKASETGRELRMTDLV